MDPKFTRPVVVEIRLPKAPTEIEHPLIGLKVGGIYSQEKMASLDRQISGPKLVSFADGSCIGITNDSGLREEVDALFSSLKTILPEAYGQAPYNADAPGFDELLTASGYESGAGKERFLKVIDAWNAKRDELFPLTDERVRQSEKIALLRDEMYQLQSEFKEEVRLSGEYHPNAFTTWLQRQLIEDTGISGGSSLATLKQCGELALRVARERRKETLERIDKGELESHERRVLNLVVGHVVIDGELTPYTARAAADFAEKLSSAAKKGVGLSNVGNLKDWEDRRVNPETGRTFSEEEVQKMLELEERYQALRRDMYSGAVRGEELFKVAQAMLRLVTTDRELGAGVVRYEQAKELHLQAVLGRELKEGEALHIVEIDLTAGGAFNKAFGFTGFGTLFRKIREHISDTTGAELIIRQGGGKLYVFSREALTPRAAVQLGRAIDEIGVAALNDSQERAVDAQIDYGIRMALRSLLSRPHESALPETDFLSAKVRARSVQYVSGDTVQSVLARSSVRI